MRISDKIEKYIKGLMTDGILEIEIQRNDLAAYFHCAPSHINYVLDTRFTTSRGFIVTSQRGSGGCIRIRKVKNGSKDQLLFLLNSIADEIEDE